jgi:glycine/D-amino acid oxidase-like deaminating enzyme
LASDLTGMRREWQTRPRHSKLFAPLVGGRIEWNAIGLEQVGGPKMEKSLKGKNWGKRPWTFDFVANKRTVPKAVDFAVVGGGFSGLTAAARLKQYAPQSSVALCEREEFGAGSSGHTGGMALAETAVGDLPGLGDVLVGYQKILHELEVEGNVELPGVYELGRSSPLPNSPIRWKDSGDLRAKKVVPGGTVHPGKVVSGLARAAERAGVQLFENCGVESAKFGAQIELRTAQGMVHAGKVLFATNAYAFELTGLQERAESTFTLALATEELPEQAVEEVGLADRKPFYTVDMPYLWGRMLGNAIVYGSGLVHLEDWRDLDTLDIHAGNAAELFARLEARVRGLHPQLAKIKFTHKWGGPICIADEWRPVFELHRQSKDAIVLGAFSGHGVAQSVYLGSWAAEALLGRRALPDWRD